MKMCRKRMKDWQTTRESKVNVASSWRVCLLLSSKDFAGVLERTSHEVLAESASLSCTLDFPGKPILVTALAHHADAPLRPVLQNKGGKC